MKKFKRYVAKTRYMKMKGVKYKEVKYEVKYRIFLLKRQEEGAMIVHVRVHFTDLDEI